MHHVRRRRLHVEQITPPSGIQTEQSATLVSATPAMILGLYMTADFILVRLGRDVPVNKVNKAIGTSVGDWFGVWNILMSHQRGQKEALEFRADMGIF